MIDIFFTGFHIAAGLLALCVICSAFPKFAVAARGLRQRLVACPAQREVRFKIVDTSVAAAAAKIIRPDFQSRSRDAAPQTGLRAAA